MISTHILDTSLGLPALDVPVHLEMKSGENWKTLARERTNADGRVVFNTSHTPGTYRITFGIAEYFQKTGLTPFFLDAPVTFHVIDIERKYHIPLLLNPYGYSTYRGS